VKRTTRFFLLAGCAFVLTLETPVTVAVLAEAWHGPYAADLESEPRSAAALPATKAPGIPAPGRPSLAVVRF